MKQGFDEEYFKNYGYEGDKSFEASVTICDVIFYPSVAMYKKLHNAYPDVYVELGCGNGYYINKMINLGAKSCVGCDFSDHFDNNILCPKEMFFKDDSISFLEKIDYLIDMVYENTCQYLDDDELEKLLTMLSNKVKKNGIVGLAYDESDEPHLYRKQKHSIRWWKSIMKKHGFKSTSSSICIYKRIGTIKINYY